MQGDRLPEGVGEAQGVGMGIERPAVARADPGAERGRALGEPRPGEARFEHGRIRGLARGGAVEEDGPDRRGVAPGKIKLGQGLDMVVQELRDGPRARSR